MDGHNTPSPSSAVITSDAQATARNARLQWWVNWAGRTTRVNKLCQFSLDCERPIDATSNVTHFLGKLCQKHWKLSQAARLTCCCAGLASTTCSSQFSLTANCMRFAIPTLITFTMPWNKPKPTNSPSLPCESQSNPQIPLITWPFHQSMSCPCKSRCQQLLQSKLVQLAFHYWK